MQARSKTPPTSCLCGTQATLSLPVDAQLCTLPGAHILSYHSKLDTLSDQAPCNNWYEFDAMSKMH